MVKQGIELVQVRRLHVDLRYRRRLLMTRDGESNRLGRDRLVLGDRQPQRVLHGVLAVAGRQLQDLQVLARRHARRVITQQAVVGQAKMARGKHVRVILVVLQRPRLAHQRVDHVPVVDGVLAVARQTRHPLNQASRPPDFDHLGVDHHVDRHADQPAGNRIRIPLDLNRAAAADPDAADPPPMVELAGGQLAQAGLFLGELVSTPRVSLVDQRGEKLVVLFAAGEVAAATQEQRLIDGRFQVAMRRFDVAVLIRRSDVDPLRRDLIVVHQVAVTLAKLPVLRQVVDRRAEAVAAVGARRAPELPKGLLETVAHGLERFRETDRGKLPVRVGEREVIQQMVERLAVDGDPQRIHVREVRSPQPARGMHLRKDDLLVGTMQAAPIADSPLEGPPLRLGESAGIALLQPAEERERPQPRFGLQAGLDFRPDLDKRVRPRSPIAWRLAVGGEPLSIAILSSRFLIHARSPCRQPEPIPLGKQPPQLSHLSIRDHRNLRENKELRLSSHCQNPGILIVAHQAPINC